jgi:hypothetical protein
MGIGHRALASVIGLRGHTSPRLRTALSGSGKEAIVGARIQIREIK